MPAEQASREVSAGGVVFRRDGGRLLVLLIRDSYRNWGFPKGHVEPGEALSDAAVREVHEETGLVPLQLVSDLPSIDWHFRFRGRLIHKTCHFFLMETDCAATCPQADEGITACRWETFERAISLISYANAREVLQRARDLLAADSPAA